MLQQLERDLVEAAKRTRCTHAAGGETPSVSRLARAHALWRRFRLPVAAVVCLTASATVAIAAGGLIPVGAPVKPREPLEPNLGEGMPLPGGARVLPMRVPDPYGGLPWGMRVIRTTRGEVCVQVGRVQNGQLGELGVDGAFDDDGRFHPIPADAQAEYFKAASKRAGQGYAPIGGCDLAGAAVASQAIGDDRNAGVGEKGQRLPRALRDLYWGLLGPEAVDVTYRAGDQARTVSVVPGLGAYLIVTRTADPRKAGYGSSGSGTPGLLPAGGVLSSITYRIDGKLCERGASFGPYRGLRVAHPCPAPHWRKGVRATAIPNLGVPIHARLLVHDHAVTGVRVSFPAPLAVTDARHYYAADMPTGRCNTHSRHWGGGVTIAALNRNVARGARVTFELADPFTVFRGCTVNSKTITIVYAAADGGTSTIVGRAVVRLPAGTSPAPPAMLLRLRDRSPAWHPIAGRRHAEHRRAPSR